MNSKPRPAQPLHPLLIPLNRHGRPAHPMTNIDRLDRYRAALKTVQTDPKTRKPLLWRNRLATRILDGITIQAELKRGKSTTARAVRVAARVRAELKASA